MSTTGTYAAALTVAEAVDEAWERIGQDPARLTARHTKSARKSMELMLLHWGNRGILQWAVDVQTKTCTLAMQSFTPATGTIDLLDVTLLRDGYETPMVPISREAYHSLPSKTQQGRPNQYFVERAIAPTVYIWPAAENATDVVRYYRIRQLQDTGAPSTNPDIPPRFFDAFCADLAARLSEKWAKSIETEMVAKAHRAFAEAAREDGERSDFRMTTTQGMYGGRR